MCKFCKGLTDCFCEEPLAIINDPETVQRGKFHIPIFSFCANQKQQQQQKQQAMLCFFVSFQLVHLLIGGLRPTSKASFKGASCEIFGKYFESIDFKYIQYFEYF